MKAAGSMDGDEMKKNDTCEWTEDENGPHETECGLRFEFTNDGVKENGFKFCCFCGGSIILKLAGSEMNATVAKSEVRG